MARSLEENAGNGELVLARDWSLLQAGEMLAFPGSVPQRSAREISGSAEELIRNISGMMQDLVASLISERTAADFKAARTLIFPKYADAALALSSLVHIRLSQHVIEKLNSDFFSELAADLSERGLTVFGAPVRDQAVFTVWTLKKISDFMSQIAAASPQIDRQKQSALVDLGWDCLYEGIRTRFHLHCLTALIEVGASVQKDVLKLISDGLRSVVNSYGSARRMLDLVVPLPVPEMTPLVWDDEDQQLLAEANLDIIPELA